MQMPAHPVLGDSAHDVNTLQVAELERSCVQVLVATPGRLVSHMHSTPGFTLRHLRFLVGGWLDVYHKAADSFCSGTRLAPDCPLAWQVVDETDRLLRQSYQEWLPLVVAAVSSDGKQQQSQQLQGSGLSPHFEQTFLTALNGQLQTNPSWARATQDLGQQQHLSQHTDAPFAIMSYAALPFEQPRCIKLVVSATLTQDPSKLSRLHLHCPRSVTSCRLSIVILAAGSSIWWSEAMDECSIACR
jgi:ATP-dependent RNA helicase DDX51/DBP6